MLHKIYLDVIRISKKARNMSKTENLVNFMKKLSALEQKLFLKKIFF